MFKRMVACLLCVVMLAGVLPVHVIAEQNTQVSDYIAAFGSVTVDGLQSETTWRMGGRCVKPDQTVMGTFDAAWNNGNIYLGIVPNNAAAVDISLNGKTLSVMLAQMALSGDLADDAVVSYSGILEISIPFAALDFVLCDYSQTAPLTITLTDSASQTAVFDGQLGFSGMHRDQLLTGSSFNVNSVSANTAQVGCEILTDGLHLYDIYQSGGANVSAGRSYAAKFSNVPLHSGKTRWIEFDFCALSMPEYSVAAPSSRADISTWGVPIMVIDEIKQELDMSITNTADGLYFTAGTSATVFHAVKLNKQLGETFRIAVAWTADNRLGVYCDGKQLAVLEGAVRAQTSNSSKDYIMFNCWRDSSAPTSAADNIDVTIRNVVLGSGGGLSVLDTLEITDILGVNTSASTVSTDLNLPSVFDNGQLQPVELVWSSSDPNVVSPDGKVTPAVEDTEVTLTVSLKNVPSVTKSFTVTVCKLTLDAYLVASTLSPAPAAPALDNNTGDPNWITWNTFNDREEGAPTGSVSFLWNSTNLYVGLRYQNADALTLEINGKTFTYEDLTGTTMKEIAIPIGDLPVELSNYNAVMSVQATLSNSNAAANLEASPVALKLTGKLVNFLPFMYWTTGASAGSSFYSKSGAQLVYNNDGASSNLSYTYIINQPANRIDHSKDMIMTQDIHVESMPVTDGAITNNATRDSLYFWLADMVDGVQKSIFVVVYNADSNGNLKLRLGNGINGGGEEISLGRTVGQTFRLSLLWKADDSLWVYVDGELKGSRTVGSFASNFGGGKCIQYRYNNTAGTGAKFTLSNFSFVMSQIESVSEELNAESLFSGVDLTQVTQNLNLPATFQSKYLGTLNLRWESSDPDIIDNNGTVTRPAGRVGVTVRLSVYIGNQRICTVDVYVMPLQEAELASPEQIHTPFTEAPVTVDGSLADEGWILNADVLDSKQTVVGKFGAQWRAGKLYMVIDRGSATGVTVTLNRKTVTVDIATGALSGAFAQSAAAVSGSLIELEIPLEALGVSVESYDVLIPVTVAVGNGSYSGSLKLTGIDWFATDNSAHRLPVLLRGSAALGTDAPTTSQGSEALSDGYRFYDLYNANGTNAAKIRSYVIFMGNTIYQPLADTSTPTYAEFDFYAESMPVYEIQDSIGWKADAASYGFSCGLAGQQDVNKMSPVMMFGIFNTSQGLVFAAAGKDGTETVVLNKTLKERFRVGVLWDTDGDLLLYIDGKLFHQFDNVQQTIGSFGDRCFSMNLYRNGDAAQKSRDSFDLSITNITLGKSFGENDIDSLTFEDIRGTNTSPDEITANLNLVKTLVCPLKKDPQTVTWISSNPTVVSTEGVVTRPASGIAEVTLTAVLPDGSSKTFELIIVGLDNSSGTVLVVTDDQNPAKGAGAAINSHKFVLDETNNSVIKNLEAKKTVNVIMLHDGDEFARLSESFLSIWVSDDNVTYTQVEGFKLLHQGRNWYLYDFEAEGRYIKVHCTHYDSEDASFAGVPSLMIDAWYEEVFGAQEGSFQETTVSVTNTTSLDKLDDAWKLELAAQRVYLGDELLYHYVEDGVTYVRIPQVRAGETVTLTVLTGNASAMDISNKEMVYEVSYGTREVIVQETDSQNARWITTLPNGTLLSIRSWGGSMYRSFSYDEGRTWTAKELLECTTNYISDGGGFILDPHTGYIYYEGYSGKGFVAEDMTKSDMHTYIIRSKDNGVTWERVGMVNSDSNYILSYSNGIALSTYDGAGPNVDFVFPLGAQYNNNGAFCARVAYSADGGSTWQTSDSKIIYGSAEAFEGGVSEANILERSDGTLVLYARCQIDGVDNFARTYSYDHGLTWVENAELSDVFTVNTQPVLYDYDGMPLMIWSGNNVLGGTSYMRVPLNVAVSLDDLDSFEYIQDLFSKYSLQCLTSPLANYAVTNPVATKAGEDTLLVNWSYRFIKIMTMRVDNFTDYLYRTKGAYDSFEHGTVKYEGWESVSSGVVAVSDAYATHGNYAMKITAGAAAARSVPYLQNGKIAFQVYADANASFTLDLQSAYSDVYGKASPVGIRVDGCRITFLGADEESGLTLEPGWNQVEFTLAMDAETPTATICVNGSEPVAVPVNAENIAYICFITIRSNSLIYVDDVLVEDWESCQLLAVYETEALIDAIGEVTLDSAEAIEAARAAYEALTEDQKAQVTNYDVLVAAEKALKTLQEANLPGFSGFLTLNETIDLNLIIPAGVETEGNVISVKYADGTDADYTIVSTAYGPAIRYRSFSNQMTREITVQIFDGEGNALTKPLTISVRGYVRKLLGVTANDTEKALMIRMLDYGALAQLYAHTNEDDLANSIIDETLRDFINSYDMGTPDAYVPASASTGGVFSANLTLNESVVMNILTNASHIGENEKLVVKLDGQVLAESKYTMTTAANGTICISYSFHSDKMNQELSVAIVDKDTDEARIEISLSIRKYAHMCLDAYKNYNPTLCTMLVAMLDYGALAQLYAKTATDDLANRYVSAEQRATLTGYPWP